MSMFHFLFKIDKLLQLSISCLYKSGSSRGTQMFPSLENGSDIATSSL